MPVVGDVLPGADLSGASLATGEFHDVVRLPGRAVVRIARDSGRSSELTRQVELLRRLASLELPLRIPEPLTDVVVVDGRAAVALSWLDGTSEPHEPIAPEQVRSVLDALRSIDLRGLRDVLAPAHAYCGGPRWAEVIAAEVVPRLPWRWQDEARRRLRDARELPELDPVLVHGDLSGDNLRFDAAGRLVVGWPGGGFTPGLPQNRA